MPPTDNPVPIGNKRCHCGAKAVVATRRYDVPFKGYFEWSCERHIPIPTASDGAVDISSSPVYTNHPPKDKGKW